MNLHQEPNETHLVRAIENGLHEAEHQHGHLWTTSKPGSRRAAAEVIAGHIDRQPWTTTRRQGPAARLFGYIMAALILATLLALAITAARYAITWAIGS